eukprot:CAMPEP_0179009284 /NCGR_PEP_ID=MMETSP0795-20121207/16190_1 /TAXON_ID=88552 /ORGANISM="Amoebophrya sp., Strain Ameob2" /LENGTH=32 /DNA_ID= /DNA_START= /DNA_END= /DNA_ORIENTATION=
MTKRGLASGPPSDALPCEERSAAMFLPDGLLE